jgi:antitoxin component YwqK of YwqJK toxin-antitoxin module
MILIFIKYIRSFIFYFILFYSFITCNKHSERYYLNHLIERDGLFFSQFENKKVFGELYEYFTFKNQARKEEYVGLITINGKVGIWTRRWNNGIKKSSGEYINSKKEGLWKDWNENGKQVYQTFYENGRVIYLFNCLTEKCL